MLLLTGAGKSGGGAVTAAASGFFTYSQNPTDGSLGPLLNTIQFYYSERPKDEFDIQLATDLSDTLDNTVAHLAASTDPLITVANYSTDGVSRLDIVYAVPGVIGNSYELGDGDACIASGPTLIGCA